MIETKIRSCPVCGSKNTVLGGTLKDPRVTEYHSYKCDPVTGGIIFRKQAAHKYLSNRGTCKDCKRTFWIRLQWVPKKNRV